MSKAPLRWVFPLLVLGACVPEAPVFDENTPPNVISGTVVVDGAPGGPTVSGPTVLFLTDANNPMPPLGTGSPLTFTVIAPEAFGAVGGTRAAPFSFTNVPDGDWLITGLVDQDQDFQPLVPGSAFSGATCGDTVGAHLTSAAAGTPAVLSVQGGQWADEVPVLLGRTLTTERPAFQLAHGRVSREAAAEGLTQTLRLHSAAIHAFLPSAGLTLDLAGPFDPDAPAPCQTAFLTTAIDADGDGLPDAHPEAPGAPLFNIWPRVYLSWVPGPEDEPLAAGERWVGQAVPSPAHLLFDELSPLNQPHLLPALDLVWLPAARHERAGQTPEIVTDPSQIPAGLWSITVIQQTGQTWTVPNALLQSEATSEAFNPLGQGWALIVE